MTHQQTSIFTDRQDAAAACDSVREGIVVSLECRGARVIDPRGLLAPFLILCEYRGQGITFAVMPAPDRPTRDQFRAMEIARDGGWYALAIHTAEQAGAVLDAIDYQRETGR